MHNTILIDDPEDERIAAYRKIRERDLVRQGHFVAEGRVVLEKLLFSEYFAPQSVFMLEKRLAGSQRILEKIPASTPIYTATSEVMDKIAGFPVHRGILAIGRKNRPLDAKELLASLPARSVILFLAGISNHDNVGSIFRNAAAFGVNAVILDETCCDPLYRKAIRVSVGSALTVPFARGGTINSLSALIHAFRYCMLALSPRGSLALTDIEAADRTALVLGSEGYGLPEEIMKVMTSVRIAMAPGFDSLNVASASAIALHQITFGSKKGQRS